MAARVHPVIANPRRWSPTGGGGTAAPFSTLLSFIRSAMPRTPAKTYDVCRAQDGALIVRDVDLATARSEAARLNAEARVPVGVNDPTHPEPNRPTGMYLGEVVRYEIRSREGLVLA